MSKFKVILFLCLISFLSGCTHALHQYHAGDVEPFSKKSKTKKIVSQAEQFVVLGFVQQTDYVDQAFMRLQ